MNTEITTSSVSEEVMVVSVKGKVPHIIFAEFIYLKRIISFAKNSFCFQI